MSSAAELVTTHFWTWLFPATYLIHIVEEFWGGDGYTRHLARTRGLDLKARRFFALNALGCLLMGLGIVVASWLRFPQLLLVIFSGAIVANSLSHVRTAIRMKEYNPGLITAFAIWIPLGVYTAIALAGLMETPRYLAGAAIGLGIQLIVSLAKFGGGRTEGSREGNSVSPEAPDLDSTSRST